MVENNRSTIWGRTLKGKVSRYFTRCKRRGLPISATKEEVEQWMKNKPTTCVCCGKTPTRLALDHNHNTGKIRGWLCNPCNVSLYHYENPNPLVFRYLSGGEDNMLALAALRIIVAAIPELADVLRAGSHAAPPHLRKDLEEMLPPKSKAADAVDNKGEKK